MAISLGETGAAEGVASLDVAKPRALATWWPRLAFSSILVLAAALEFVGLSDEGWANTYYSAAIKSMLTSWHNFFYLSFDAGGFVSVDKSPLGLWLQAASAKVFGFSGLSMLAPEALAGVLSVALLYRLVARPYGRVSGLLAALFLALTPITSVVDRNNTIDSTLILTLLLGVWTISRAAETGRLRWLMFTAVLLAAGFNIKMLQAYLVLPAFVVAYCFGAPLRRRVRLAHLLLAGAVLLVLSLAWLVAVDMTPPGARPYVSDSGTNSELSLALGYNGLGRVTQLLFSGLSGVHIFGITIDLNVVPAFAPEIGNSSAFRLLTPAIAEQASWLLPLALLGLIVASVEVWRGRHTAESWQRTGTAVPGTGSAGVSADLRIVTDQNLALDAGMQDARRRGLALVIWGGWLLAAGTYFSTARFYHLYYLAMLAPPIAALAGIGLTVLWRLHARASSGDVGVAWWPGVLLPAALLATAALQLHVLQGYSQWGALLPVVVVGGSLLAAIVLVARLLRLRFLVAPGTVLAVTRLWALGALSLGVLALLAAPATWSVESVANGNGGAWLPQAGPDGAVAGGAGGSFARPSGGGRSGFGQGFGGGSRPGGSGGFGRGGGGRFGGSGGTSGASGGSGRFGGGNSVAPGAGGGNGGFGGVPTGGTGRGGFPQAGGRTGQGGGGFGGGSSGGAMTFAGSSVPKLDPKLIGYLLANQHGAKFLVATTTTSYASLFILQTNQTAMALGGYQGWDRILTPVQLAQEVADNTVRFFYIPTGGGFGGGASGSGAVASGDVDQTGDLTQWVRTNCSAVPSSLWQTGASTAGGFSRGTGGLQLYSCAKLVK